MHHPTDRIVHTTAFVTPFVVHWLEQTCLGRNIQTHTMLGLSIATLANSDTNCKGDKSILRNLVAIFIYFGENDTLDYSIMFGYVQAY